MTMFQLKLAAEDIEAREMANAYFEKHDGNISSCEQAVLMIFAQQAAGLALTVDNIINRAIACNYVFHSDPDELAEAMQKALTKVAKNGFLRSRMNGGKRLYEVKFAALCSNCTKAVCIMPRAETLGD